MPGMVMVTGKAVIGKPVGDLAFMVPSVLANGF